DRGAHRLFGDALLFGYLLVRGPRERAVTEAERLAETHDTAHDRDVAIPIGPAGHVADVDRDPTLGIADGDGVRRLSAHHHAFEHRLPAHVAGLGLTRGGRHDRCYFFFAFAYRRWKRSTRPPVSTSFCLPV